jgi:hypothetical protein
MLIEIFIVKVRQFAGSFGRSFSRAVAPVMFYLLYLLVLGLVSITLRFYGVIMGMDMNDFVRALKPLATSGVLAVGVFLGLKGGVTALGYEIDYIFTSNVRPRTYLWSDFLFQFIFLNVFSLPSMALVVTVLTFPRHLIHLFNFVMVVEAAVVSSILISHLLGLLRNWLGRRCVMAVGGVVMILVLMPLLDVFASLAWVSGFPFPTTLLLGITEGGFKTAAASLFMAGLLAVHLFLSKSVEYAGLAPILTNVFTDPPRKFVTSFKLPEPVARFLSINPGNSPAALLVKAHLTRFLRDGSLWITAFVLLLLVYVGSALPRVLAFTAQPEAIFLTIVSLYTPMIPALLSFNWLLSEKQNLWLVQLSVYRISSYFYTLLAAYVIVSLVFSSVLVAAIQVFNGFIAFTYVDGLLFLCSAVFGSFLALMISSSVKRLSSPFSFISIFIVVIPLLGSQLLSLPLLMSRLFEPLVSNPPAFLPYLLSGYALFAFALVAYSSKNFSAEVLV